MQIVQIQQTKINQIIDLHNELEVLLNKSLDNMVQLGGMLAEIKEELPHGQFGQWIENNLPFTDRTARRYMKVYNHRAELGEAENITDAYNLLSEPKTDTVSDLNDVEEVKQRQNEKLDKIKEAKEVLQKMMEEKGIKSIIPNDGEKVCLHAFKTLDPYLDSKPIPFSMMEIWRVDKNYIDVSIKRLSSDCDYGYEIYNTRGGVKIDNMDFLVRVYMDDFPFVAVVDIDVKAA